MKSLDAAFSDLESHPAAQFTLQQQFMGFQQTNKQNQTTVILESCLVYDDLLFVSDILCWC